MSVAAIIVNYNAGDWLARSVNSVLQDVCIQSVYVVDNCSEDQSLASLESRLMGEAAANKLTVIKNTENVGFGLANNQVLRQLLEDDGVDYALLINPDCELAADVLPVMLRYFQQNPDLGMASCVINNSDGSIQATCRRRFPTPWTAFLRLSQLYRFGFAKHQDFDLGSQPLPDALTDTEAISGAFMLVRMAAVNEVGVFDESYFMHCEDLDWCKRFAEKQWRVGFVPEVAVVHEKGVSSESRKVRVLWYMHQGMLRFFDKFYQDQYPFLFRLIVRLGVYASFFARATVSLIKQGLGNLTKAVR